MKKSFAYSRNGNTKGIHQNFCTYVHRIRIECSDKTTDILERRNSEWFKNVVTDSVTNWFTDNGMKLERHVTPSHWNDPTPPVFDPTISQAFYAIRTEGGASWRWPYSKKERTWITFYFLTKDDAMKFKLAWSK
jgi:hypothetical protein